MWSKVIFTRIDLLIDNLLIGARKIVLRRLQNLDGSKNIDSSESQIIHCDQIPLTDR